MDNEEMRKLLLETDICRIMIREVEAENENRDLVLQIMINLSGDELFQPRLLEFNSIYRISNLLYRKIPKEKLTSDKDNLKKEIDLFAMVHGLLDTKSENVKVKYSLEKYLIDSEENKNLFNNSFDPRITFFLNNFLDPKMPRRAASLPKQQEEYR